MSAFAYFEWLFNETTNVIFDNARSPVLPVSAKPNTEQIPALRRIRKFSSKGPTKEGKHLHRRRNGAIVELRNNRSSSCPPNIKRKAARNRNGDLSSASPPHQPKRRASIDNIVETNLIKLQRNKKDGILSPTLNDLRHERHCYQRRRRSKRGEEKVNKDHRDIEAPVSIRYTSNRCKSSNLVMRKTSEQKLIQLITRKEGGAVTPPKQPKRRLSVDGNLEEIQGSYNYKTSLEGKFLSPSSSKRIATKNPSLLRPIGLDDNDDDNYDNLVPDLKTLQLFFSETDDPALILAMNDI